MSRRKAFHKITAMLLSAIMVVGMTPVPASADTGMLSDGASGEIIAFEALKSEIAEQSLPLGTSEADLELPDTLTATVRLAASGEEPVLDSGETKDDTAGADPVSGSAIGMDEIGDTEAGAGAQIASPSDAQEDGGYFEAEPMEKTVDSVTETTVSLPVTWGSSPDYDADTADTYTFTPILPSGYTAADGVELPVITVAVEADSVLPNALIAREIFSAATEQFTLTPGGTYYFDLSGETIPGTKNTALPDSSLKWVPFTYAGTVNAYTLEPADNGTATTEARADELLSDRSLFVADYNITHTVSWNNLYTDNLIFGKNYTSGGVAYTLRSLSVGSNYTGSGEARRGTPETNEWDQILNKDTYIKNWGGIDSWGQDTYAYLGHASYRAIRGYSSARFWNCYSASSATPLSGFRPALEILNPDTLGSDGLKTVTLKLNGGKLKDSTDDIRIVYTGNSSTAPGSEGLTAPTGKLFSGWKDDHSTTTYVSGAAVPHTVTSLSAQWVLPAEASPTAIFTATGADTGTLSGVTDGMKYRVDTGSWIDITGSAAITLTNLSACTVEVVKKGNGTTTADSPAQGITVTKADTPALTATQPSTIGGNGSIPMTTNHEYRSEADSTWTSASGNTSLAPGTYLVRIKANGTLLASESQSITLTAYVPDEEATPAAIFTATGGNTGTLSNVTDGMKYRIDSGSWIDITGSAAIPLTNLSACTIEVVKKGNDTTTVDSSAQEITVTKADTPALTATQPSTIGGNGSIPMTTNHEYQSQADSTWTPASGNTTLAPGTYLVRIKADGTALASDNQNITLTAFTGGSGGGGGDGGSYTPDIPATIIPEKKPDQPVTVTASVIATAGANGTASAAIPDKAITDAIAKAQADARAQGKTANGISVGLNVTMPKGATSLTATLTQNSLNSLVNAGVSRLELDGAPISLSLDLNALKEIQKQSSGDITITIAPATELSKEAKALLGNRPVYSVTISYVDKNGKTQTITSLGSGLATLSIPYTPGKNEAVGYLFGVYVDAKGKAQRIDGSAYDANSGSLLIPTGHFSVYGVGYTAPSAKFTDIGTHWGKEAIDYVVGRGLLSGTSKTTFAPDTAMTRGMLVTALGRLAGMDVKAYTANSFTDVKTDSAFRPYIEWAYKKGIVQGIGNQQFAPDRAITREEIAVIFANYAKATGYKLPVTREAAAYTDVSSIGSTYNTAVTAMQQAGIMMGGTGNKFNPKSNATRAEVSSMLHRYIKLTIDPTTAQGWAKNDAGQWLYYKDGKALTGTQTIDGVKYFFETNGTLKTGWVKDGDNWHYYSGNKAAMGWLDISDKRYYFTKDGLMVSGKWLEIDGKWYYFYADGALAKNTKIDGYEVDKNGVRKTK